MRLRAQIMGGVGTREVEHILVRVASCKLTRVVACKEGGGQPYVGSTKVVHVHHVETVTGRRVARKHVETAAEAAAGEIVAAAGEVVPATPGATTIVLRVAGSANGFDQARLDV